MIKKTKIEFPAFSGKELRNLYIYLPQGYKKEINERYPVLYMFDGHNVFYDEDASYGYAWHLDLYLNTHKTKLIVVALECHKGKDGAREKEYSPFPNPYVNNEGYGEETMKWFISKLKKYIDTNYRTLKDRKHTYIMGSSMGGIMTTYALLKYNNIFSKGCSLSPAYFLYPKDMMKFIQKSKVKKDTTIYTDYGTNDLYVKKGSIEIFNEVNTELINIGVNVTSRIVKDGKHHESTWEKQLPFAIETLMYEGVNYGKRI